jgi:FixJ family two-component response regulator
MLTNDSRLKALQVVSKLDQKENLILAGLVNGLSIGSIASILSIPVSEARRAKTVLMDKLEAKTTADAVRIGIYANVRWPH